jgi:predicted transcriptional regulator
MSTTTIRISPELKARIAQAAERTGKTTHSFILEAISEKTEREESAAVFDAEADARFSRIVESGQTIPWSEMRQFLEDRMAGKPARRPAARKKQG